MEENLYIGHSTYKINRNHDTNWENPSQIPDQIRLLRQYPGEVHGSVYFSSKWFAINPLGVSDSLSQQLYRYPAFLPTIPWKDRIPPQAPIGLETDSDKQGIAMIWENTGLEGDAAYYAVYRSSGREEPTAEPESLVAIIRNKELYFLDRDTRFLRKYNYIITALDHSHNESKPSDFRSQRRWSLNRKRKPKKKR